MLFMSFWTNQKSLDFCFQLLIPHSDHTVVDNADGTVLSTAVPLMFIADKTLLFLHKYLLWCSFEDSLYEVV